MSYKKKDPRYETVELYFKNGRIKEFADIFGLIPKTVVANDMGIKTDVMNACIANPGKFRFTRLLEMAHLIGVPPAEVVSLALKQAEKAIVIRYRNGEFFHVETRYAKVQKIGKRVSNEQVKSTGGYP